MTNKRFTKLLVSFLKTVLEKRDKKFQEYLKSGKWAKPIKWPKNMGKVTRGL